MLLTPLLLKIYFNSFARAVASSYVLTIEAYPNLISTKTTLAPLASFLEAIEAASSNDIINLTGDVSFSKPMEVKKNLNINLNNHTIEGENQVFLVQGGSLNLTGTGTIRETKPTYKRFVRKRRICRKKFYKNCCEKQRR